MDWLPLLNLLLVPVVGLLLSINRQLATLSATQEHHARELLELGPVMSRLAVAEAVLREHARRLDSHPATMKGTPP